MSNSGQTTVMRVTHAMFFLGVGKDPFNSLFAHRVNNTGGNSNPYAPTGNFELNLARATAWNVGNEALTVYKTESGTTIGQKPTLYWPNSALRHRWKVPWATPSSLAAARSDSSPRFQAAITLP